MQVPWLSGVMAPSMGVLHREHGTRHSWQEFSLLSASSVHASLPHCSEIIHCTWKPLCSLWSDWPIFCTFHLPWPFALNLPSSTWTHPPILLISALLSSVARLPSKGGSPHLLTTGSPPSTPHDLVHLSPPDIFIIVYVKCIPWLWVYCLTSHNQKANSRKVKITSVLFTNTFMLPRNNKVLMLNNQRCTS